MLTHLSKSFKNKLTRIANVTEEIGIAFAFTNVSVAVTQTLARTSGSTVVVFAQIHDHWRSKNICIISRTCTCTDSSREIFTYHVEVIEFECSSEDVDVCADKSVRN